MKPLNIFTRWALIALTISIAGACSDDGKDVTIRLSEVSCIFDSDGGERLITVDTGGEEWRAEIKGEDSQWFTFSASQTEGMRITAPANKSNEVKRASIAFAVGSTSFDIPVMQDGPAFEYPALSISPALRTINFQSDGGAFTATVTSGADWTATLADGDPWAEIHTDKARAIVRITAGEYTGSEPRRCSVLISDGDLDNDITLEVIQHTRAENPYLSLTGEWNLYSDKWYYADQNQGGGVKASCTIEAKVLNESYTLRDLIRPGMELEIYFDPDDNTVGIPLGWLVARTTDLTFYLSQANMSSKQVESGYVTGTASEDGSQIGLSGFRSGYGLAIVASDGKQLMYVSDLYAAIGETIRLQRAATRAAAADGYFTLPEGGPAGYAPRYAGSLSGVMY